MRPMQNPFLRSMLHNAPGVGSQPQPGMAPHAIAPQQAPKPYGQQGPQGAPQGQNGLSWQQALGFGLMSLGEGMGGPRSLAPLIIQSMMQRQAQERELQAEQGQANTEQKQELAAQGQQRQQLASFAQHNNLTQPQIAALMADPENFLSNWNQQYRPQSTSPGERIELPNGTTIEGNPRYYPVTPGARLVLDPGYQGGTPGSVEPDTYPEGFEIENEAGDVMVMRGGQWVPANGGPASSAPGNFRQ